MTYKLSAKSIFLIIIISIITIFVINYINRKKQIDPKEIKSIVSSKEGETVGVNIEQSQQNGEKIKIIADIMEENKDKNFIKLTNPIAKIIKKNNITKITSKYGYIINNYSKFKLNKNVNIYNDKKRFALKTEEITGMFDSGDMHSNSPVQIQINNSKIEGSSLSLRNYGEYVKVFGKSSLTFN